MSIYTSLISDSAIVCVVNCPFIVYELLLVHLHREFDPSPLLNWSFKAYRIMWPYEAGDEMDVELNKCAALFSRECMPGAGICRKATKSGLEGRRGSP